MRALLYFPKMYEKYIVEHEINIYSSSPKKFPFPQHIVFYNGTKDEPDRTLLKLSDLFEKPPSEMEPCLECTSTMLNINYGHNRELMEKCKRLKDYAVFVDTVRKKLDSGDILEHAVSQAVDECISNDVLADILTAQKAEVIQVVLETFDQERYEKAMKQEGYEDGYNTGFEEGLRQLISTLIDVQKKYNIPEKEIINEIMEKFNLPEEEVRERLKAFR